MRTDILGVPFDALTLEQAAEFALSLIEKRGVYRVVTPNPEMVWRSLGQKDLMDAVKSADLILADGIGITLAARFLQKTLPERIPGIDWARKLLPFLAKERKKLFLLGGKPGVAQKAAERLACEYPGVQICGFCDGYFKDERIVLDMVQRSQADVVFVCLGSPRQELWMAQNAPLLDRGLLCGLGGTLDILSGEIARAPRAVSRIGLEWVFRALQNPARLPRLLVLPRFVHAVFRQKRMERMV